MRGLIPAVALALSLAAVASPPGHAQEPGETRYVVDTVVITVRAGPGEEEPVVARLASGDAVELIGEREDVYAQVRLPDGLEGWVDARYLTPNPVARTQLEALEQAYAQSQDARIAAEESLVQLSDDYQRLTEEIEQLRSSTIQPEDLEAELEQLEERLEIAQGEAEQLRLRNKELAENEEWTWFLTGAGVLAAGIILGFAIPRGRRRRSSWERL